MGNSGGGWVKTTGGVLHLARDGRVRDPLSLGVLAGGVGPGTPTAVDVAVVGDLTDPKPAAVGESGRILGGGEEKYKYRNNII